MKVAETMPVMAHIAAIIRYRVIPVPLLLERFRLLLLFRSRKFLLRSLRAIHDFHQEYFWLYGWGRRRGGLLWRRRAPLHRSWLRLWRAALFGKEARHHHARRFFRFRIERI